MSERAAFPPFSLQRKSINSACCVWCVSVSVCVFVGVPNSPRKTGKTEGGGKKSTCQGMLAFPRDSQRPASFQKRSLSGMVFVLAARIRGVSHSKMLFPFVGE